MAHGVAAASSFITGSTAQPLVVVWQLSRLHPVALWLSVITASCGQHCAALSGCMAAVASSAKLHPVGPPWSLVAAASSQAAPHSPQWLHGSCGLIGQAASSWASVALSGCCIITGSTVQPSMVVWQLLPCQPSCIQLAWLLQ